MRLSLVFVTLKKQGWSLSVPGWSALSLANDDRDERTERGAEQSGAEAALMRQLLSLQSIT